MFVGDYPIGVVSSAGFILGIDGTGNVKKFSLADLLTSATAVSDTATGRSIVGFAEMREDGAYLRREDNSYMLRE